MRLHSGIALKNYFTFMSNHNAHYGRFIVMNEGFKIHETDWCIYLSVIDITYQVIIESTNKTRSVYIHSGENLVKIFIIPGHVRPIDGPPNIIFWEFF